MNRFGVQGDHVHRIGLAIVLGAAFLAACKDQGFNTSSPGGNSTGGSAAGGAIATGGGGGAGGADASLATDAASTCRPSPPCPSSSWYVYSDHLCSPPYADGTQSCSPNGDGLCYQECNTSADCTDPLFPTCGSIYVFGGSDYGQGLGVCKSVGAVPACPSRRDAGADLCATALPLECGDNLNDSTVTSGRANAWVGYGQSQRWEGGREVVYAFSTTSDCEVIVTLSNLTTDLDLFGLSTCDQGAGNFMASSTPLGLQTVETIRWTNQAGQTAYVVVDGYAGAQGSYSLAVACTCN
jgi:hypothetical protein